MWGTGLGVLTLGAALLAAAAWFMRRFRWQRHEQQLLEQRSLFSVRREWLEAKFLQTASSRGTPRGLEWIDCDFDDSVSFARDRRTGELTALVAVAIQFRAVEGGGMEEVEAVAHRKAASALFRFRDKQWMTEGRAIFNLNPLEAIEYYHQELERVE